MNAATTIVDRRSEIETAIAKAEEGTCGEIVVAFARQAGRYEREQAFVAFGAALAAWTILWRLLNIQTFIGLALALVGGYLIGHLLALFVPYIPMLLAHQKRRRQVAERAALVAFHDLHVTATRAHTGILLYIAYNERTVVVLGDGKIAAKVTQADWNAVRNAILEGMRSQKPVDGIVEGILYAGGLLAQHFPPGAHNRNELPNSLYVVRGS
ncbi:MAG TPA: hypothetical protein VG820_13545 [Fimbriimonadaceae bacterium]|nr:hypothetical protein [Fimbriimonadaceae bacterium]